MNPAVGIDIKGWFLDRAMRSDAARRAADAALDFKAVERFALFVGPQLSGSRLIAHIVNSHPEAIVSRELDAPERVRRGWNRELLFGGILARDLADSLQKDSWVETDFMAPGSFPGTYQHLMVVGDEASEISTGSLLEHAGLWERFVELVGVPVSVVQNIRNPFDNIARIAQQLEGDLDEATSRYFDQLVALKVLEERCDDTHFLPVDVLVSVPELTIRELCSFLGLEAHDDFVDAAAQRLLGTSGRARDEVEWPDALREKIEAGIAAFPQLGRYGFDE